MKILGIIPARGGSKSIPHKNIYPLNGKPLIWYTIDAAQRSDAIDRLIVSSDDDEILKTAREYGVEIPFKRPIDLAADNTPSLPVVRHAVEYMEKEKAYKPDYIVLLQPTSPLRKAQHIDEALNKLCDSNADSIVSVITVPHQFSPVSIMKLEDGHLCPYIDYDEKSNLRQKKPIYYARNGAAIYAFTYNCIINKNSLYGEDILPYFMNREESVDIDDFFDLKACEFLLKQEIYSMGDKR